jgi:prepilin-type N-terminal cleavage/methylation domain-containing protein
MNTRRGGFTLVELLIVIFVIGILLALVITNLAGSKEKAYMARANVEFATFANAINLYADKYNDYPADVSRGLPPGIEEFIAKNDQNQSWPDAPWPGSVYDYDRWDNLDGADTLQISIRFCPVGGPLSACHFPDEPWAKNFGIDSAVYYCIKGNCRAHVSEPATYPGYCVNCPDHKAIGT